MLCSLQLHMQRGLCVCLSLLVTAVSPTRQLNRVCGTDMGGLKKLCVRQGLGSHGGRTVTRPYPVGGSNDAAFRCQYRSNLFILPAFVFLNNFIYFFAEVVYCYCYSQWFFFGIRLEVMKRVDVRGILQRQQLALIVVGRSHHLFTLFSGSANETLIQLPLARCATEQMNRSEANLAYSKTGWLLRYDTIRYEMLF